MLVKVVKDGYITMIGRAITGTEITEQEYGSILSALQSRPETRDGFSLMLRDKTLEWEFKSVEPEPLTDEESLTRYANTLTGADDPDLLSAAETLITERIKEES